MAKKGELESVVEKSRIALASNVVAIFDQTRVLYFYTRIIIQCM